MTASSLNMRVPNRRPTTPGFHASYLFAAFVYRIDAEPKKRIEGGGEECGRRKLDRDEYTVNTPPLC